MEGGGAGERTPLVQPTYVFEASLARSYQKRLRHFQCAICIGLMAILGVALLVTVSYDLSEDFSADGTGPADVTPSSAEVVFTVRPPPVGNLSATNPDLAPLLTLEWPLKEVPSKPWVGGEATAAGIAAAVDSGAAALQRRKAAERARRSAPSPGDTPAARAQAASATARAVQPLADAGYAAEHATRALLNGTTLTEQVGDVGVGPPVSGLPLPPYCELPSPCPLSRYRSFDGSCNNLLNPNRWGVSNTPFRRVLPPSYADGVSAPRRASDGGELPSARDVSVTVHRPSYARDAAFTVMLAVFGQFLDHDVTATALSKGENSSSLSCCEQSQWHPECFPVSLSEEDPFYRQYNLTCMEFVRSAPAPMCHFGARQQLNQATAYIDGSAVYGWEETRADSLRAGSGGALLMLRAGSRDLLPPTTDPADPCNTLEMAAKGRYCFASGDDRANENLHLTTMHLVWARQHNRVAQALAAANPAWGDQVLYQEARRVVAAQLQHITYNEFLPNILGADLMAALNLTLVESGYVETYDPGVDASIANHFSAAAFRFAHTLLPSVIRDTDSAAAAGSAGWRRLHEVLFNPFQLWEEEGPRAAVNSALNTPVRTANPHVTEELSEHLFERAASSGSARAPCGLDLVSLNIQRGRDHGLPGYAAWRRLCSQPPVTSFQDLKDVFDQPSYERIVQIYRSVEDVDMYTGLLAEAPQGRLVGATLSCLLADQFLRLKRGDRFWYERPDPDVGFTLEQLEQLRKTTLAGVLCANEQGLQSIQPRAMQEPSPTNPLLHCNQLPQPDFSAWRAIS